MHLIDTTIFWLAENVLTTSFKSQALNLNPKLMKLCWSHRIKLSKVWARFTLLRFWHNISLSLNTFSSNFWVCWTRTLVWGCPQPGNYFLSNRSMCRLFLWFSMIAKYEDGNNIDVPIVPIRIFLQLNQMCKDILLHPGLGWTEEDSEGHLFVFFMMNMAHLCSLSLYDSCSKYCLPLLIKLVQKNLISLKYCLWSVDDAGNFPLGFCRLKWFIHGHWPWIIIRFKDWCMKYEDATYFDVLFILIWWRKEARGFWWKVEQNSKIKAEARLGAEENFSLI